MAEDFPQNKILKYLTLGVVVAASIILIKEVILKPKKLSLPEISPPLKEIKIDFNYLKSQELQELLPFERISIPKEIGRENPFEPY
jgi:hypothetical protein